MAARKARKTVKNGTTARRTAVATAINVPEEIVAALDPGETIEADFNMGGGLVIYATGRRVFGQRDGRLVDIRYDEVSEARRRTADWRTWQGIARIAIGIAFMAAGALTGFGTAVAAMVSLLLLLFGGAIVALGIYRRDDWVELKIDRREPPPSFWYMVMFLPFWLMLQSRKRYRVPGRREQVDAFYQFLTTRLPAQPKAGS